MSLLVNIILISQLKSEYFLCKEHLCTNKSTNFVRPILLSFVYTRFTQRNILYKKFESPKAKIHKYIYKKPVSVWVISFVHVPVVFGRYCQGFLLSELRVIDHMDGRASPAEDEHWSDVGYHTSQTDLWFCKDAINCEKIRDFAKNVWSTITGDDNMLIRNSLRLKDFEKWHWLILYSSVFFPKKLKIIFRTETQKTDKYYTFQD